MTALDKPRCVACKATCHQGARKTPLGWICAAHGPECHTFANGETFPDLCHAPDCPTRCDHPDLTHILVWKCEVCGGLFEEPNGLIVGKHPRKPGEDTVALHG